MARWFQRNALEIFLIFISLVFSLRTVGFYLSIIGSHHQGNSSKTVQDLQGAVGINEHSVKPYYQGNASDSQLQTSSSKRFRYTKRNFRHGSMKVLEKGLTIPVNAGFKYIANDNLQACFPQFIIIGVQKAGTSAIMRWLDKHPNAANFGYEAHYWDCLSGNRNLRSLCKRLPWFNETAEESIWKYPLANLKRKEERITFDSTQCFEKSPSYFDMVEPEHVHQSLIGLKVITILRNPTARLYAGYWQNCKRGQIYHPKCSISQFRNQVHSIKQLMNDAGEDCVSWDPYASTWTSLSRSWDTGRYFKYLAKWFTQYKSDFHVSHFESFVSDPFTVMDQLQDFVQLPRFDFRGISYKDQRGFWTVRSKHHQDEFRANRKTVHAYEPLDDETRNLIEEMYKPCIIKSCDIIRQLTPNLPKYMMDLCERVPT